MIETTLRKNYYVADGATTTFPYTFKVVNADQLRVYFENPDGDLIVQSSGFIINGVGDDSGGSVVFDAPPGLTYGNATHVLIIRQTPIVQTVDIEPGGQIGSTVLERALDYIICALQEIQEDANRAVTTRTQDGSVGITIPNSGDDGAALYWEGGVLKNAPFNLLALAASVGITLPSPEDGKALRWNAGVLENYTPVSQADLANISVSGSDLYLHNEYSSLGW